MSNKQQEIVQVYVKKERKNDFSGSKQKGKSRYKGNDLQNNKFESNYIDEKQIIDQFNTQDQFNGSIYRQFSSQNQQGLTIEEEKEDYEIKIRQIKEIFGDSCGKKQIKNALRCNNMDLEATIDNLTKSITNESSNKQNKNILTSSSNSTSSNSSYQYLRQFDFSEEKERLRFSQRQSSDKEISLKVKYALQIKEIKKISPDLRDEIIIEALEMHQGDLNDTLNYLLDESNIQSLETCLKEHNQDLNQVKDHLGDIVHNIMNIVYEEEQNEFEIMMEQQNDEEYDDMNIEDDIYINQIKKSMSYEEQHDPNVQRVLKMYALFAKQLKIMNEINQKNNGSPPKTFNNNNLKKTNQKILEQSLENFKQEYVKRQSEKQQNLYIIKESEFPSIIKQKSGNNRNIVKELQKNNQREYNPNKNEWSNTVFKYDNSVSELGKEYLQYLTSKFPHVEKDVLVDIFYELSEDHLATEEFLIMYYGKSNIKQDVKIIRKSPEKQKKSYYESDDEDDEDQILDQKIKNYQNKFGYRSLKKIREEIINAYRYSKTYQFAQRNADTNAMFNLNKYFQSNSMSLEEMKEYSKALFLHELRQQNPMVKIDLHGFFAEEALEILKDQIMYVKKLARSNRVSELKIIVTGRGSHSQNKISVLKPKVSKFLEMAGYNYKVEEGKIMAKIPY